MSFAESNSVRATEVNLGAGFQYASSLKLVTATTATYTLSGGDQRLVEYDATGGPGTLKLPPQPDDWMEFEVAESANLATALTVDGNGNTINGSTSYVLNAPGRIRIFRFVPATGAAVAEWKVVGGVN